MKIILHAFETVAITGTIVMLIIVTLNLMVQVMRLDVPPYSSMVAVIIFFVVALYWSYKLLSVWWQRGKSK